jgi:glycosyltransferase involved in cell wall biosynthesis
MSRITKLPSPASPTEESPTRLPHVLLVLDTFPKAIGGGETIALRLASLLPSYGYRASILIFSVHPESGGLINPPCPLYLLPIDKTYDANALRAALELRRFLRDENVEIVQTFFESSDIWAGFVTKFASDARLIWSRRDMGILRSAKHHIAYRLMATMPDAVFAVSEQVRRHSIEVDGIDPDKVRTVYNGLDLGRWNGSRQRQTEAARTVITTVGNIRRVKGHDILLKAAAEIVATYADVRFEIGGDILEPEFFAELQALVQQLGLQDHVRFVGPVRDLFGHLSVADIFVLPSRSEGFSNAIIEGMAAGLPVVATDVGGNAEAVENGVSGYIVRSEDPHQLATALLKLLQDPELARKMGTAAKQAVASRFTTDAMMQRVISTYADLRAR